MSNMKTYTPLNTYTNYTNVQSDFLLLVSRPIHHFMFYCLNNESTAWTKVLREKLPVPQLIRNYPHFMECKRHLSFVPIMSQLNLFRILQTYCHYLHIPLFSQYSHTQIIFKSQYSRTRAKPPDATWNTTFTHIVWTPLPSLLQAFTRQPSLSCQWQEVRRYQNGLSVKGMPFKPYWMNNR